MMKRVLLISCLLLVAGELLSQQVKKVKITEVQEYIQKSTHPLIVSFWATWCAPCLEEIPYLEKAVKEYTDKKAELLLVSLDYKDAFPGKINSFVKKNAYEASIYWLDETNADYFCPLIDTKWDGGIPATLLINNKTGYRKFFGRQLTPRQVEQEVRLVVGE